MSLNVKHYKFFLHFFVRSPHVNFLLKSVIFTQNVATYSNPFSQNNNAVTGTPSRIIRSVSEVETNFTF